MILHSPAQTGNVPKRIICLVPSLTELLFDLGLGESVVGITKFCIRPPDWQTSKIIIGGTKNININKIRGCSPDLIIANKEENVKEQVENLAMEFDVLLTEVTNLKEALQLISHIGIITRTSLKAGQLIDQIEKGFAVLTTKIIKLNTCYLIWRKPYMTVGGDTFISDMMLTCGFNNLYRHKIRYPLVDMEQLKKSNCRLLILSSEPYPFQQKHIVELQTLLPGAKIILADGEMFSWYGSRLLHAPAYFNTIMQQLE